MGRLEGRTRVLTQMTRKRRADRMPRSPHYDTDRGFGECARQNCRASDLGSSSSATIESDAPCHDPPAVSSTRSSWVLSTVRVTSLTFYANASRLGAELDRLSCEIGLGASSMDIEEMTFPSIER